MKSPEAETNRCEKIYSIGTSNAKDGFEKEQHTFDQILMEYG